MSLKLVITYYFIITLSIFSTNCSENKTETPIQPPAPKTYSVTVTNNLVNSFSGNIETRLGSMRFPTITPGQSRTITGITEGVYTISASGVGFVNISASIPVYDNFHACIEGGQTITQIPFWVACP